LLLLYLLRELKAFRELRVLKDMVFRGIRELKVLRDLGYKVKLDHKVVLVIFKALRVSKERRVYKVQ
jgi:hypothetical protein